MLVTVTHNVTAKMKEALAKEMGVANLTTPMIEGFIRSTIGVVLDELKKKYKTKNEKGEETEG